MNATHKVITPNGTRKITLEGAPLAAKSGNAGPVTLCAECAHVDDADFACSLYVTDERQIGGRNVVMGCVGFVAAGWAGKAG